MKPVLTVFFICVLIFICQVNGSMAVRNKRYYDSWDSAKGDTDSLKGWKKGDICDNKPLWFLKHQARLGKLSPFYECIVEHGLEQK